MFEVSAQHQRIIDSWGEITPRTPLFITTSAACSCGEDDLLDLLAKRSYDLGGFEDSPKRHYIRHTFPFAATQNVYDQFLDKSRKAAQISDAFYGVEVIDVSTWVGQTVSTTQEPFTLLLQHFRSHEETDFVIIAASDSEKDLSQLYLAVRMASNLPMERIDVLLPSTQRLTRTFFDTQPANGFAKNAVEQWFDSLKQNGKRPNLDFARSCGHLARGRGLNQAGEESLTPFLDACAQFAPPQNTRIIGF